MAIVTIEVTQGDIARGTIHCEFCPVALAIKRRVGIVPFVAVDEQNIHIDDARLDTPEEVAEFIGRFDDADPVDPFAFDLDIPDEIPILGRPAEIPATRQAPTEGD